MTVTAEAAPGNSSNSPSVSPKARAMRRVTARVGLACSRSISLSIDRLTPLALARASSDQPRAERRCFTRLPRCRLIGSAGGESASGFRVCFAGVFISGFVTRSHFVPVLVLLILTPRRQIDYEDDDEDENEWTVQAFQ